MTTLKKPTTTLAVLFVMVLPGLLGAQEGAKDTSTEVRLRPTISSSATWSTVSGDARKFREHLQMQSPLSGGVDRFLLSEESGGLKFEVAGRALYQDDYGLNLGLSKKDLGSVKLKVDNYRRYYDSTVFYHPYQPNVYKLNSSDLHTDRSLFGIEATLALPNAPKLTVGYERMGKEGDQNLPWGGALRDGPSDVWIVWGRPLSREVDYVSHRLYFAAEHTIAGFHLKLRQDWERFTGKEVHLEPYQRIDQAVPLANRFYNNTLDHTTWTTRLDVTKDLIEKNLTLDASYEFQRTKNENKYDVDSLTPAGAFHYGEHSLNFINNDHAGTLGRHTIKTNLTWQATDDLTFSGGIKYRRGSTDNKSRREEEGSGATANDNNTDTVDETWFFNTRTTEDTWTESVKAALSYVPKTKITLGADFEQSKVHYDWNAAIRTVGVPGESTTGQGDWNWDADTKYTRNMYWVNIRSRPWNYLTINLKYKYKMEKSDVHENLDRATNKPGDPEFSTARTDLYYPGRIESWRRPTHQVSLSLDIKPSDYVTVRPVLEYQNTHYRVQNEPTKKIAEYNRKGYGIAADFYPVENAIFTLSYMRQDIKTSTVAQGQSTSFGRNPLTGAADATFYGATIGKFDGSNDTLSGAFTYNWKKVALKANAGLTRGEGNWDTNFYWAGVGVDYKINDIVSANLGYTHYTYDEGNNGGINDYKAHVIALGLTARF